MPEIEMKYHPMVLTENYSPVLYPIHGLASCIIFVYMTFHRDI